MTDERRLRVLIPIVVCAAILGALLVLTANLDDIALAPGRSSPDDEAAAGPSQTATRVSGSTMRLIRHLLFIAFTASLAIVLLAALFTRLLRKWLYFTIGLFGALIVFDLFASKLPSTSTSNSFDDDGAAVATVGEADPTDWGRVLLAVGLSVAAGGTLVLGTHLGVSWWRASRDRRTDPGIVWELEQLVDRALAGCEDTDLVLRCYHEMVALLSRAERIEHATLTAREFTDRLRDLGLQSDAVDRLTELFELVRYGHRDSEPFSGQALTSLEEVRRESPPSTD